MTEIIKEEKPKSPQKAASVLNGGGVIIYPTDTLYGIGADAFDEQSVRNVFISKGRPVGNPIPILVKNEAMLREVGEVSEVASILIDKFLPGPLTVVLNEKEKFPPLVTAGTRKVAIRISSHPFVVRLFNLISRPITSSSANISGQDNIFDFNSVYKAFDTKVDLIIDSGTLDKSKGSTVVDLTVSPPIIVREGDISRKLIEEIF
ncbi:L-threonylcarbamoyladenylate synthase [Desulfobacterota bacterium AH_259_B03_O07]|nr:L-threonylcarbamoyladenylate synthase [Desulfobacterota bacterium AH_259_B03_O07]